MIPDFIRTLPTNIRLWVAPNIRAFLGDQQPRLWLLSLFVGIAVTIAAILFRELIGLVQMPWLKDSSERIISAARDTHWLYIFLAPVCGGLVVGIMLQTLMPQRRTLAVADVIEARALTGRKLGLREGFTSLIVTAISLDREPVPGVKDRSFILAPLLPAARPIFPDCLNGQSARCWAPVSLPPFQPASTRLWPAFFLHMK